MKILVTGSTGFLGKNFISKLISMNNIEIVTFNKLIPFSEQMHNFLDVDFIFHFAGVCRSNDPNDFYSINSDLTKEIVDFIKNNNLNAKLIFASSIHADLDTDYGKSKKIAENYVKELGDNGIIFRFHNIFGKWASPNHHSVIATFCYNIIRNMDINVIEGEKEVEFIYIDDVIKAFLDIINSNFKNDVINYITPRYKISINNLANTLKCFKKFFESISLPAFNNDFERKLFETFITYAPENKLVNGLEIHKDSRGYLVELFKIGNKCQVNFSKTLVGQERAGHFHDSKTERIMVLNGEALIKLKNLRTNEYLEIVLDDTKAKECFIPAGYYHTITNIGSCDLDLVIWADNIFNHNNTDTYVLNGDKVEK